MKEYDFPCYVTQDEEDETMFYVYLPSLGEYWIEHFGQEDWDNADFGDIDCEIQTCNPELFYVDRGSSEKGDYLLYTTDESKAQ